VCSRASKKNLVYTENIPGINDQSDRAPLSIQLYFSLNNSDLITTDISECESKAWKSFDAATHAYRFEMAVPDPQSDSSGSNSSLLRQSNQLHVYLQHNTFISNINCLFVNIADITDYWRCW
jgi:hypothetical protein